jgi:ketosteroid isomerase-like protein
MTIGSSTDEDELAVQTVIQGFVRAVKLKDVEGMLAFCAPDVVTFDMMPPLRHDGANAVREIWTKTLAAFDAPMQCDTRHLKVFVSDKIAFGRCLVKFGGKRLDGGASSTWMCMTLGLRKIERDWKIVHQHVSVPVDMESGRALLDLEP